MKTHTLSVKRTSTAAGARPAIISVADWLPDIGFIPRALVQVLPEPNGLVLNLCDKNIPSYRELDFETTEQGGKLIQVCKRSERDTRPMLSVSGKYILDGGLAVGDRLVARYDYGIIRVRKFPDAPDVKFMIVSKKSQLSGEFLVNSGFKSGDLVTVKTEPNEITLKLQKCGAANYSELVRYARQNKLQLLQVRSENNFLSIVFPYSCIEKVGAEIDDIFAAHFKNGVVKLQKLDFEKLGF